MNAHETHLGKILEGIKQYVVPLFQRPYTWDESRWKVLWADLVELCEDEQGSSQAKPHFLGSIITVPIRSVPEGVNNLHFETNLSAEAIARYCQQIVVAAGYSSGDWIVETKKKVW